MQFAIHFRRKSAAEHGDVRCGRTGNSGKKHAEQGHYLREPAPQMPNHRLREPDHANRNIGRRHQIADEQEKGHGQQGLDIHAIEYLRNHRSLADGCEHGHQQHRRYQRESDWHAHVAE
jgi:hypothetical protein